MKICKYFLIVFISYSCNSSSQQEEKLLHEAAEIHNEMVHEMQELKQAVHQLQRTSKNAAIQDSIPVILSVIEEWEQELVEVPGNEHSHENGEHHHHQAKVEVTSQELLNIQRELDGRRKLIKKRFNGLINREF
jgi:hypothetical protein